MERTNPWGKGAWAWLATVIFCSALLAACGDDDDVPSKRDAGSGTKDASTEPSLEQCYATAMATDAGLNDEAKCACDKCLSILTECDADEGCKAIRECTQRTGCRNANECYLIQGLCRDVIEQYGATGYAATLSQQLGDCVNANNCSTPREPECSITSAFECDGNEDCPGSQVCCGYTGQAAVYERSTCKDTCDAETFPDAGAGFVSEFCHPDDTCPVEGHSCLQSTFLPDFLYRCRDTGLSPEKTGSTAAGEVNCGDSVCGSGQKCCVRAPKDPYCAPVAEECSCDYEAVPGNDAGTEDGGN